MYYIVTHVDPGDNLYAGTRLHRCVGRVGVVIRTGENRRADGLLSPDRYLMGADPDDPNERWWFYLDDLEEASEYEWECQRILDEIER